MTVQCYSLTTAGEIFRVDWSGEPRALMDNPVYDMGGIHKKP